MHRVVAFAPPQTQMENDTQRTMQAQRRVKTEDNLKEAKIIQFHCVSDITYSIWLLSLPAPVIAAAAAVSCHLHQ